MEPDYEKMFADLPEHIREIAVKLAVKQSIAASCSMKMEMASAKAADLRSELSEIVDEIEYLKCELRDQCQKHVKENR